MIIQSHVNTFKKILPRYAGIGKDYYIGRPKSKTQKMQVYGDTKGSKEEFIYNANNLLETSKTWNRDNTGWLQEKYTYDKGNATGFGNITKKETTNSIDANKITEETTYEDKGRFVISKTDNLGLITNITYNNWGQVLTQTDPFGVVLTNTYDSWGKLLISKTNLGGTTSYAYEKLTTGDTKITETAPDGNIKVSFSNKIGQQYKSVTKDFAQNSYIAKETAYDILGRKLGESEPYTETSINTNTTSIGTNWNRITYDDTVFPPKVTAQSFGYGKKMETSVSGRTTTMVEKNGYGRTTSKTTDAIGNLISATDKGGTITYTYNAAGEQTKATYAENIVTTTYDSWGRKSSFNDPANGLYSYEYKDGFGKLTTETSPKGTKNYSYKTNGLLETIRERSNERTPINDTYYKITNIAYNSKWQVISKTGNSNTKNFSNTLAYDTYGRVTGNTETFENKTFYKKNIVYDNIGRVTSYEQGLISDGVTTAVPVSNVYSVWSGALYQLKQNATGQILWELQTTNAKGQVLTAKLGAAQITNTYDYYGFLDTTKHISSSSNILDAKYVFNAIKNELTERHNYNFNIDEYFTYDDNNHKG